MTEFEEFEAMRWLTQIHTHTFTLVKSLAMEVALVTTQVEVVSMAMTDSHHT